jgi:ABC-2 type transport system ATP-binding protein
VVAEGTPETVGGRDTAPVTIGFQSPPGTATDDPGLTAIGPVSRHGDRIEISAPDAGRAAGQLVDWARAHGCTLAGLDIRRPSLEDVYLTLAVGSAS